MLNTIVIGLLKVIGVVLLAAWAVGAALCLVAVVVMTAADFEGED